MTRTQTVMGPYRLLRELGSGAMGRVYLAATPGGRDVAVKVVHPELAARPEFRARFAQEVAAARSVNGAYTAPVVDADPQAPLPWLATAYVAGPSLLDAVDRYGPMAQPDLHRLALGLIEAVKAIHAAGVIHRDLKPGNVMLSDDGPRVIDFGISRALEGMQALLHNPVLGTPGYLSPEQARQDPALGPASDVFSLGAVLCFAATGRGPFDQGAPEGLTYRVIHEQPELSAVPPQLLGLVEACLRKDPALRPSLDELPGFLGQQEPETLEPSAWALQDPGVSPSPTDARGSWLLAPTAPQPPPGRAAVPLRSRRWFLAAAGGCGLAAAAGAGLVLADRSGTPQAGPGRASGTRSPSLGLGTQPALSAGPQPLWTLTPPSPPANASLTMLGDNLVWASAEPDLGSEPSSVLIIDAATGALAWTTQGRMPSVAGGQTSWYGVFGSTLVGGTNGVVSGDDTLGTVLFGLDPQGTTAFQVTLADTGSAVSDTVDLVYALSGQILLVLLLSGVASRSMSAIDLTSGRILWSQPVSDLVPTLQSGTADEQRGYLIDGSAVYGFDLSTGKQLWSTASAGSQLLVAGSALLVSSGLESGMPGSSDIVCLDCTTGRTLWTSAGTYVIGATAELVYAASDTSVLSAIDLATGETRWRYRGGYAPLPTQSVLNQPDGPCVSAQIVVVGVEAISVTGSGASTSLSADGFDFGFLVLDAATGTPLWYHSGILTLAETEDWPAVVSGSRIYVTTTATLYAFDAASGKDAK